MNRWQPGMVGSGAAGYQPAAGGGSGQLAGTDGPGAIDQSFLELMASTEFGPGAATEEQLNSIVQSFKEEPVSDDDGNASALLLENMLSARQGIANPVPWPNAFQAAPPQVLPNHPLQNSLQTLPPPSIVTAQAGRGPPHLRSASPPTYYMVPSAGRRMSSSPAAGYGAVRTTSIPSEQQGLHVAGGTEYFAPICGTAPSAQHQLQQRQQQQRLQQIQLQQQQIIQQQLGMQHQQSLGLPATPSATLEGFAHTPLPSRTSPVVGGLHTGHLPSTLPISASLPLAASLPLSAALPMAASTPVCSPALHQRQSPAIPNSPAGFPSAFAAPFGERYSPTAVNGIDSAGKPPIPPASQPVVATTKPSSSWRRVEDEDFKREGDVSRNRAKKQRIESPEPAPQSLPPKSSTAPLPSAQVAKADRKPSPAPSAAAAVPRKPPQTPSAPVGLNLPRSGVTVPSPLQTPGGLSSYRPKPREDSVSDKRKLFDVTADAGVDLEAEQEEMMARRAYRQEHPITKDRVRKQTFLNETILKKTLEKISKSYAVSNVHPDAIAYIGLAAENHLRDLLERMMDASKHRTGSQAHAPPPLHMDTETGRRVPAFKIMVQQDVKRQLLALERAEREDERARKKSTAAPTDRVLEEVCAAEADATADRPADSVAAAKKGKHKGFASRNLPEDLRKRISDQTALMSAGLVQRAWMVAAAEGAAAANLTPSGTAAPLLRPSRAHGPRKVTARDALFTLEQDGGSAIGRSAIDRILIKGYPRWLR